MKKQYTENAKMAWPRVRTSIETHALFQKKSFFGGVGVPWGPGGLPGAATNFVA